MKVGDIVVLSPMRNWIPRFGRILRESPKTYLVLEFRFDEKGDIRELYRHRWRKEDCYLANERVLKLLQEGHGLIQSYEQRIEGLRKERAEYLKPILEAIRHEVGGPC